MASSTEDVDEAIDDLNDTVSEIADDTIRWSQEQAAEIYDGVAEVCVARANSIRQEIADGS